MTVSIPDLKSIGDVYELTWKTENVHMRVDHISEGESLTAEFEVGIDGTGKIEHLYNGRFNMQSVNAKKSFSEALKRRLDLEWETIIEQACYRVIHKYREGDPITDIGVEITRNKPRYRLYPFIMEDNMTSLFGYGGSCKSYVAAFVAIMIQSGKSLLGFNPIQGNVLVLDWETCKEDWDERIMAICAAMGIELTVLPRYKRCYRTLQNDILEIQKEVLERDIKFIIIDSVGMASELSEAYHSSAISMLRAARSLKCSVLLLDHKSKNNELFGSVYKLNEVRSAFEIEAKEEPPSTVYLSIKHEKLNNGAKSSPFGLRIDFSGDENFTTEAKFSRFNVEDVPELAKNAPLKFRLISALNHGPQNVQDLAVETQESEATIRMTLNRYKDIFIRVGTNWGLLSKNV